jgi:hypothetical protein
VARSWCGRIGVVTRVVHVPYVVEQDEDGVWCASAQLRPGVGAVGDGPTAEAAVGDLRDGLEAWLAEVGPPDELTLTSTWPDARLPPGHCGGKVVRALERAGFTVVGVPVSRDRTAHG